MFSHDHTVLAAHNWHNFGTGAGTINGTGTLALARGALARARAHWHWHGHIGTGIDWIWHWHHRRHGHWHWHHLGHHLAPPRIRLLRRRWTSNRGMFTINRYWHWHATWHHWHWHLWHGHWHGHLALWHGHWHYDWHDWHMMAPSPKTDRSGVPRPALPGAFVPDFPRPRRKGQPTEGSANHRAAVPPLPPEHTHASLLRRQ